MEDLTGALVGGTFRVHGKLAEGGMGTVYRAIDEKLDRPVALKVMKPDMVADAEFLERFSREAKALASLQHPALAIVYAFGEEQGLVFMALELVEGKTLHVLVHEEAQRLSPRRACGVAIQVLDGLSAAHDKGIIHRDVKPGNIMISRRGGSDRVKLLDFGLVKLRGRRAGTLTDPSVLLGTPSYMAPELIKGDAFDHRIDLYALGTVLYEMLAGRPPFEHPKIHEILRMHVKDEPERVSATRPDVPPELEAIVARALAKSPDERFATARELADALEALLDVLPSAHEPGTGRYQVPLKSQDKTLRTERPDR